MGVQAIQFLLSIPGPLPGLNEILAAKLAAAPRPVRIGGKRHARPNGYADLKRAWTRTIGCVASAAGVPPIRTPAALTWVWCERDKRRDPSNFTSGGRKLIEDALICAKLLEGDGWRHITDLRDHWLVCPERAGVTLIASDRVLDRATAIAFLEAQPRHLRAVYRDH